nr:uncharacterized protein LOC109425876 [Aedes albopictus]
MVIDDLRRFKTPIRTPTVPSENAPSSLPPPTAGKNGRLRSPSGSRTVSNDGNTRLNSNTKRCEQRKWREILQNHQSPNCKQQQQQKQNSKPTSPRTGATTNDRITTINYEILDTRRRRSADGSVKTVDADRSSRRSLPVKQTALGGSSANPSIECNYEPKTSKLNFRIKVPGNPGGKTPMKNVGKK